MRIHPFHKLYVINSSWFSAVLSFWAHTYPFESDSKICIADAQKELDGLVCYRLVWRVETNLPYIVQAKQVTFLNNLQRSVTSDWKCMDNACKCVLLSNKCTKCFSKPYIEIWWQIIYRKKGVNHWLILPVSRHQSSAGDHTCSHSQRNS